MAFYTTAGNIHTSIFQQLLPTQPRRITREEIELERRIPIDIEKPRKGFELFNQEPNDNIRKVLGHSICRTKLSDLFFSPKNIKELQNLIRYQVHKDTKHVIETQDEVDLLIIMRANFLQFSTMSCSNDPIVLQKEVDRINLFVLREAVPDIITNVQQYFGYLRDASEGLQPIDRPVYLSNSGTRELRSTMDILNSTGDPRSNGIRSNESGNGNKIDGNFEGFRNFL